MSCIFRMRGYLSSVTCVSQYLSSTLRPEHVICLKLPPSIPLSNVGIVQQEMEM
uniref:Uncharacterized protein n=1 Tax=Arundo donax TaxID=35708 RepID=A0A0A9BWS7_ARUDO